MSNTEHNEQEILEKIKAGLDQSSEQLDPETRRALQTSRYSALAQLQKPNWTWQPVAGVAVAASVALLVFGVITLQTNDGVMIHHADDMSLLSSGEDLEFYENLEFYQWLQYEERSS
jgi:hypothetical protein